MRVRLLIAALLLVSQPLFARERMLFGDTPEDKTALALRDRIVGTYRSQGIPPAIRMLDQEVPRFIAGAGATARYDLYSSLNMEAVTGNGAKDREWELALIEWCYRHCRQSGESYWYGWWVPMMHDCYFKAGRYGEARQVIDYEKVRRIEAGTGFEVEKLAQAQPVHGDFPALRKRTLGPDQSILMKDYRFFLAQAGQDLTEGKWRRGMEAAALAADRSMGDFKWSQARPENTDSKLVMTSYTGHWRCAKWLNAKGFRFLGLPELELKECEQLAGFNLEEGREVYKVQMARARILHLKHVLGLEKKGVVGKMEEIRALQLSDAYKADEDADLVHLMIADVHFRDGNAKQGWEIIQGIRAKRGITGDLRLEADSEWCRHRVDTAAYEGVEELLVDLLEITREGGLKQREIGLYEIYARLLIGLGRYEDALAIQRELIRLLRSFDLFPRLPAALRQLAVIHALIGERALAEATVRDAKRQLEQAEMPVAFKDRQKEVLAAPLPDGADTKPLAASSDLQPLRSMMIPLEGFPARGLLTLANHSAKEISGELGFKGAGLAFRNEETGSILGVDVAVAGGEGELRRKVTLAAGEILEIDLSRAPATEAGSDTVAILWEPAGGEAQTAEWSGEVAEQGVSLAITDAGEYLDNPFYLIPIHHLLQYQDAFTQVADVRVVASKPARIEIYDQNDELVLVDADGDGALNSPGDLVSKDLNRNGAGDLVLDTKAKESRFRLFVRPAEVVPGEELSLDLQLFQQGEWLTHSTDRILFTKARK